MSDQITFGPRPGDEPVRPEDLVVGGLYRVQFRNGSVAIEFEKILSSIETIRTTGPDVEEVPIRSLRFDGVVLESRIWFGVWFFRRTPVPEVPLTTPKPVCVHCGEPCISMCPGCGARVHQAFGFMNANCSGLHEGVCLPSRTFRITPEQAAAEAVKSTPVPPRRRKRHFDRKMSKKQAARSRR